LFRTVLGMNALDEDWNIFVGMLPPSWQRAARLSGAVARLRGFDSIEGLLRVLLLHVGCGYSLRETTVRAQAAGLAEVSDVTLLNRLRQAEGWLQHLCQALLAESGVRWSGRPPWRRLRALDGTVIQEPGRTGSHWRIHYSLRLPELTCDQLVMTSRKGPQTAENLERFPVAAGDLILADRGYCHPAGVAWVRRQGGDVIVRLNSAVPLFAADDQPFRLLPELRQLPGVGHVGQWEVGMHAGEQRVEGRLCAVRKSQQASAAAERKITRHAQKHQIRVRPETREYAHYVMVFTTVRAIEMGAAEVLEYYRFRWQIELVFKRLKSLLAVGHLPKHDARSSRAWLYGKLLVALLTQKLVRLGSSFSPWGYELGSLGPGQSLAGVSIRPAPTATGHRPALGTRLRRATLE
jgi:hypothetical protein